MRNYGYYWVIPKGCYYLDEEETIANWSAGYWYVCGSDVPFEDTDFKEIGKFLGDSEKYQIVYEEGDNDA